MAINGDLDQLMSLMNDDEGDSDEVAVSSKLRGEAVDEQRKVHCSKVRRSSLVSMGNQTFHSAADDVSWLERDLDLSDDQSGDMDETLSPMKQVRDSAAPIEESPDVIAEKLRQLDAQREALQKKLEQVQPKRTLVALDFGPSRDQPTSSKTNSSAVKANISAVHTGDLSSDEDEFYRNRDSEVLTKEGRQLKKNLTHHISDSSDRVRPSSMILKQRAVATGQKVAASAEPKDSADVFDSKFGVRVRNPKVSSATFGVYCGDMQKIRVSDLRPGAAPMGEWITMGVLVDKSGHKKSANDNEYMIMRLSDLTNCQEPPIKLLLFGECLKQQWKLNVATVVALVRPMWLGDSKDASKEVTLKLTQPSQLVEIGQCPDFAFCKGARKDGQSCRNFVNRSLSEHCVFHLTTAAKSLAARRGALQSDSNIPPKSWNNKALGDFSNIFYGGRMVGSGSAKAKKGPPTLTLEQSRLNRKVTKVLSDATSSAIATSSAAAEPNSVTKMAQETPHSFGSRNLLKHIGGGGDSVARTAPPKSRATSFRDFVDARKLTTVRPPTLARGARDGLISLDCASVAKERKVAQADSAKRKAAELLRQRGSIPKTDPNSVKSSSKATKRPLDTSDKQSVEKRNQSPVKKRSKLGDIDLNDEQIRAILDKKSSHEGELDEEDKKREMQYFNGMEIKEKIETGMTELREMKNCKVVTCKRCSYTWHSQSEFCKTQGHLIKRHTADKRFFKCRQCAKRCISYELLPSKPCQGCAGNDYERVGMKDERKGPLLPRDTLKLRGDEEKYVG